MSATYGVLMRRAAEEVARALVTMREPNALASELSMLAAYRHLVGVLGAHTRQLLHPHALPTPRRLEHATGFDALASAMADQLRVVAGRPRELDAVARASHWHAAAVAVGAASDLLATHAEYGGRARSPVLDDVLASPEARRAALVDLADLTSTVLQAADQVERRLHAAGLEPARLRRRLPDPLIAQVLARECGRIDPGVADVARLDDVRPARPTIDTSHPLLELGDRLTHLRLRAWVAAQPGRPSVDDLKVFAALGVAVNTHAKAFVERATLGGQEPLGIAAGDAAVRARSWRSVTASLQPWRTSAPAHAGVVGHSRRVLGLLRDVAPLSGGQSALALPDRDVTQALRAAVRITTQIAEWNTATLQHLPDSHPTGRARDLTGAQVTDDTTLAAAKLADDRVEMTPGVYAQLRAEYAVAADRPQLNDGVFEAVLASQLVRPGDVAAQIVRA